MNKYTGDWGLFLQKGLRSQVALLLEGRKKVQEEGEDDAIVAKASDSTLT